MFTRSALAFLPQEVGRFPLQKVVLQGSGQTAAGFQWCNYTFHPQHHRQNSCVRFWELWSNNTFLESKFTVLVWSSQVQKHCGTLSNSWLISWKSCAKSLCASQVRRSPAERDTSIPRQIWSAGGKVTLEINGRGLRSRFDIQYCSCLATALFIV